MTTWIGTPVIGVLKLTKDLGGNSSGALGLLAGGDIYGWMDYFDLCGICTVAHPSRNVYAPS